MNIAEIRFDFINRLIKNQKQFKYMSIICIWYIVGCFRNDDFFTYVCTVYAFIPIKKNYELHKLNTKVYKYHMINIFNSIIKNNKRKFERKWFRKDMWALKNKANIFWSDAF